MFYSTTLPLESAPILNNELSNMTLSNDRASLEYASILELMYENGNLFENSLLKFDLKR